MNSTSAASAVVSGVVALIRSRYPGLSAAAVRTALITSTTYRRPGGLAVGSGYGAVNADKAMAVAGRLAAPSSALASAGAQPVQVPAPVAAAPAQGIAAQILRAGELSGALLLLLLLLIAVYAATGRRRRRPQAAVATEWTQGHGQSRYPHAGAADADPMLELFAAPDSEPERFAGYGAGHAVGYHGGFEPTDPVGVSERAAWADNGDEGLFAPAGNRRLGGGPAVASAPGSAAEGGSWPAHGPASRAVSRHANVSGAPPWEPAAAPDGELPWTATPGRHANAGHPVAAQAGDQSWPSEQQSWPSERTWPSEQHWTGEQSWAGEQQQVWPGEQAGPDDFGEPAEVGSGSHAAPAAPTDWVAAAPPGRMDWGANDQPSEPDRQIPHRGFGAPTGFSSATGRGPAADFSYPAVGASDAGIGGEVSQSSQPEPRVAPSGLPVRQPRAARPATPKPLSPSGSLWDPVDTDSVAVPSEPGYGEGEDPGSRPIFVWNPATAPESYPAVHGD